jgi:hypothetical protein
MKKIYLALPYTHIKYSAREHWIGVVRRIAKLLILQSYIVICPVLQIYGLGLPTDWKFWEAQDITFLEWCDELWIIILPDWEKSNGIQLEIRVAKILNKKIVYMEPNHE